MSYEIRKQEIKKQPIVYAKGSGAANHAPELMGKLLNQVTKALKDSGAKVMPQPFTRFISQKDDQVTMWVGFRVKEETKVAGVESNFLPGGNVLVTEHNGSYETIKDAHAALIDYIEEHKLKRNGEPWEIYYTDPDAQEKRDVGRTVVVFPIE